MTERLPLSGKTVLVTRPEQQAKALIEMLQQAGATVLHQPAIEIKPIPHPVLSQSPEHYDLIIFISQNAVQFGLQNLPIATSISAKIAAIGKATSQTLTASGFKNIIQPEKGFTSEDLLELPDFSAEKIDESSILIVRGGAGRETLKEVLAQRGAHVEYVDVYQRQPARLVISAEQILQTDTITVSSQQGLENLVTLYDQATRQRMFKTLLIVPSSRCHQSAQEMGFNRIEIAANATDSAMLNCIIDNIGSALPDSS